MKSGDLLEKEEANGLYMVVKEEKLEKLILQIIQEAVDDLPDEYGRAVYESEKSKSNNILSGFRWNIHRIRRQQDQNQRRMCSGTAL